MVLSDVIKVKVKVKVKVISLPVNIKLLSRLYVYE
jgi:hypothetical protein